MDISLYAITTIICLVINTVDIDLKFKLYDLIQFYKTILFNPLHYIDNSLWINRKFNKLNSIKDYLVLIAKLVLDHIPIYNFLMEIRSTILEELEEE